MNVHHEHSWRKEREVLERSKRSERREIKKSEI
jgi:hypothetical protein